MKDTTRLNDADKVKFSDLTYEMMATDRLKHSREVQGNFKFASGDHGQPATSRVIGHASFPANPIERSVPISTVLLNTKITQILSNPPIPIVSMKVDTEDQNRARTIAVVIQKKLEAVFDDNFLYQVIHQWVTDAAIAGVGWMQVTSDDRGVHLENLDFDEVLIYPKIKKVEDSPLIGKVFTGIIAMYQSDSNYKNIEKLSPNGKGGESIEAMQQKKDEKLRTPGNIAVKSLNSFKGVEWQVPIMLTEKRIKRLGEKYSWIKKKNPGDVIMHVFAVSQGYVIRDTIMDTDTYNIFALTLTPGPIYGPSLLKLGMSTNRAIDNIISQVEFYAATALKFRILANRQADIGDIDNVNGGIVEWSGEQGFEPTVMEIRDIPQSLFEYLSELLSLMNFIYGVSPGSVGQQATGGKSKAAAMEAARMTDFFNNTPQVRRLEIALTKVTRAVLDIMANSLKKEDFAYEDMDMNTGRMVGKKATLYGEKYLNENKTLTTDKFGQPIDPSTYILVKHDYPVDIQIAQGLNYSSDSIRGQLMELVKLGILPQEIVSDIFSYGKLLEWIEMAKKREAQKQQDENAAQMAQSQNQQGAKMQLTAEKAQQQYKLQELKGRQQLAQKTQPMLMEQMLENKDQGQEAGSPGQNTPGVTLSPGSIPQSGGPTSEPGSPQQPQQPQQGGQQ